MNSFPDHQKDNLIDQMHNELQQLMSDESLTFHNAFNLLSLKYLEYDESEGIYSDGKNDNGIDFGLINTKKTSLFQFKAYDFTSGIDESKLVAPSDLGDLQRIERLITDIDNIPEIANSNTKKILNNCFDAIKEFKNSEPDPETGKKTYRIDIFFVTLMSKFSEQAEQEYSKIDRIITKDFEGVEIEIKFFKYFLNDLIQARWRQNNTKWKNSRGQNQDFITLTIANTNIISESKWCVFFAKCKDLVQAYRDLGYQIFEPNVRCKITRSPINDAIKETLSTERGIREFKHLNNGITIVCDSFKKPSNNSSSIKIIHPGIINGLQTITSTSEAYENQPANDLKHFFEENCEILVRLHQKDSVKDSSKLIKSTNNQNPMQPRNLRSNDPEQRQYQEFFSELGWFYSRKEKEWDAFKSDPKSWPLLKGKKPKFFEATRGFKKIDNHELAKSYLSFIGFTLEALNKKKELFSDDSIYNITFKKQIANHGKHYSFSYVKNKEKIDTEAKHQSQAAEVLLLSHLLQEAAKSFAPKLNDIRNEGISRLKLEGQSSEEINAALKSDQEYAKSYILRGTTLVFSEMVGYIMFKTFKNSLKSPAKSFLLNGSMREGFEKGSFDEARNNINNNNFEENDLLATLWAFYVDTIESLTLKPDWLNNWKSLSNLSSYHHGHTFRNEIIRAVDSTDAFLQKKGLKYVWSSGLDEEHGIFNFTKKVLK